MRRNLLIATQARQGRMATQTSHPAARCKIAYEIAPAYGDIGTRRRCEGYQLCTDRHEIERHHAKPHHWMGHALYAVRRNPRKATQARRQNKTTQIIHHAARCRTTCRIAPAYRANRRGAARQAKNNTRNEARIFRCTAKPPSSNTSMATERELHKLSTTLHVAELHVGSLLPIAIKEHGEGTMPTNFAK